MIKTKAGSQEAISRAAFLKKRELEGDLNVKLGRDTLGAYEP